MGRPDREWIANDRQLHTLIDQMRNVAAKATDLITKEAATNEFQVNRKLRWSR